MTLLRHLAAKDLRILRWPLLAWLMIVVARVVVTSLRGDVLLMGNRLQLALETVDPFFSFADLALFVLMMSWLVHEDPVVGLDRFWMTRPIEWPTLLGSKLGSTVLWLVVAPIAVQFITVAIVAHSWSDAARTLGTAIVAQTLWTLLLLAFASATPTLGRLLFVIAGVAGTLAAVISILVATTALLGEQQSSYYQQTELADDSGSFVALVVLLATAIAFVVTQYRTRRTLRSGLVAIAGLVLMFIARAVWPWSFAKPIEPSLPAWAGDRSAVVATLDRSKPPNVQAIGRPGSTADTRKQVKLPLGIDGLPPEYTPQSVAVRGRLALPGGKTIESAQTTYVGWNDVFRLESATSTRLLLRPDPDITRDRFPFYVRWPVVLTVSEDEYNKYAGTPGRLTLDLRGFVHRAHLVGALPLAEGAVTTTAGARFEVRRIVKRDATCSILVRKTAFSDDVSSRRQYQLVLRNSRRGELLAGDVQPVSQRSYGNIARAMLDLSPQATRPLPFADQLGVFPSQSLWSANLIDEQWLADAEIAIIEDEYAGSLTRTMTIDGFRMKP